MLPIEPFSPIMSTATRQTQPVHDETRIDGDGNGAGERVDDAGEAVRVAHPQAMPDGQAQAIINLADLRNPAERHRRHRRGACSGGTCAAAPKIPNDRRGATLAQSDTRHVVTEAGSGFRHDQYTRGSTLSASRAPRFVFVGRVRDIPDARQ